MCILPSLGHKEMALVQHDMERGAQAEEEPNTGVFAKVGLVPEEDHAEPAAGKTAQQGKEVQQVFRRAAQALVLGATFVDLRDALVQAIDGKGCCAKGSNPDAIGIPSGIALKSKVA